MLMIWDSFVSDFRKLEAGLPPRPDELESIESDTFEDLNNPELL